MSQDDSVITITNLSVSFSGSKVLREVSLAVPANSIKVVLGPSGSGKTTLLRAVNRLNDLYPGSATDGSIQLKLDGRSVEAMQDEYPLSELRRKAAMVFQSPNILPFSIEKNFAIPLKAAFDISRDEVRGRMESSLREVHLFDEVKDRLSDNAASLSGGQQQRLCLARALVLEPEILLLDEPTANLDHRAVRLIEELLVELKKEYAILAVSHSLSQARRIADHVVLLNDGAIVRELDGEALQDTSAFESLI